jgi:hypothetical protein
MLTTTSASAQRYIAIDALLLGLVAALPALSHVLPFPAYYIDPMRILLFSSLFFTQNRANTVIMAMLMPMVSVVFSGHPPFPKAILISLELLTNIAVFFYFYQERRLHIALALFGSMVLSKVAYYIGKWLFLQWGWVEGVLVSTPLSYQLATISFLTVLGVLSLRNLSK